MLNPFEVLAALSQMLDLMASRTLGHALRRAVYADRIARRLAVGSDERQAIAALSLLGDLTIAQNGEFARRVAVSLRYPASVVNALEDTPRAATAKSRFARAVRRVRDELRSMEAAEAPKASSEGRVADISAVADSVLSMAPRRARQTVIAVTPDSLPLDCILFEDLLVKLPRQVSLELVAGLDPHGDQSPFRLEELADGFVRPLAGAVGLALDAVPTLDLFSYCGTITARAVPSIPVEAVVLQQIILRPVQSHRDLIPTPAA